MAASSIAAFWAVTVVLIVVPGPDWAYAISSGLQGRVISAAGGIVLGYGIMTMVVAAGIGALVAASPVALTVLTMIGGVYLMWLGGKALAHPATHSAGPDASTHGSWSTLAQGVAVSGLNPKGLLIFVAMLPQFTDPHADWPVAGQIGVLGLVFMLSCAVVYLLVGSLASAVLNARPAAAHAFSRVSGVAMIIIGAVLLVEHLAAST
jgi:threonine/homoserine/homoserine lactone efflux protein